jgi:hypothetical protein
MLLAAAGDAALGNVAFGYRLTGAQPGITAFCFANVGPCTPGVPIFCGLFHVPLVPPPINLGAMVTVGAACASTAFQPLPIPVNPAICGTDISAQDVIICPGFGIGLTNAVCVRITDS